MASVVQVTIDDTSPCISYSPFRDTFTTPNLSAGWNPYYDQSGFATSSGETGNGTSLHITSLDGASLALQWRGTAIELWGNVTSANYSITLDGQTVSRGPPVDNMLANLKDLPDASHTVVLTAQIPDSQNPPNSSMLVFDRAVIASNAGFKSGPLDDNEISFLGRWSFETNPNASFHTSHTAGDRALTTFNGTAFLMSGRTSPQAGNFTVTLDNVTTTLSGRSSFTDFGSILFFSTGLDPQIPHAVEVRNVDGGELSLSVGGFQTFIPNNPPSPNNTSTSPSPAGATVMAVPKGTIAAFALAGILAFIAFSGLLYFFLIWRPRSRRRRAAGNGYEFRRQSPKEQEGGMVLDIGPGVPSKDMGHYEDDDWNDYEGAPELAVQEDRRYSGRSGFSRWTKEAVGGTFGGINLGINFRHSDSAVGRKDKGPRDAHREDRHMSEPSSVPSLDSSTRRKAREKSKGKARQLMGKSWSSTHTLDLPLQTESTSATQHLTSRVTSGALSSFYAAERSSPTPLRAASAQAAAAIAPPSYAASVSASNSNPSSLVPSGPRSVSQSPENTTYPRVHYRDSTRGFLLHQGEPSSDQESPQDELPPTIQPGPLRPLSPNESGNLSIEDNPSITEPASLREVIRGLSPRTVITPPLTQFHPRRPSILLQKQDTPQSPESEVPLDSPTRELLLQPEGISLNDPPPPPPKGAIPIPIKVIRPLPSPPMSADDEDLVEIRDGVFLSVRETSPFQVNFDSRSTQIPTNIAEESITKPASYSTAKQSSKTSSGDGSKVIFASTLTTAKGKSKAKGKAKERKSQPEFVEGASSKPFRLTPMTFPSAPAAYNTSSGSSDGVTSFLDFTSSREPSLHARSVKTTTTASDQERNFSVANQSIHESELKSRWSNVTASTNPASLGANSASGGTNESSSSGKSRRGIAGLAARSTGSSTFPIAVRVTVPPSPHHIMDANSPTQPYRRSGMSGISDNLIHTHPHLETIDSPTDSIPMSVSDLHFRHSDEEDGPHSRRVTGSSLMHTLQGQPGHPPLPGSSADDRIRPFDPSILVSRVLGLPSPTPVLTLHEGHSRSASATAATTLSPLGTPRLNPDQSAAQSASDLDRSRTDLNS